MINGTLNLLLYQKIQKENVLGTSLKLKSLGTLVMQQYNDTKHTSKSITELLKKQGFGRVRVRIEIQFSWFGMTFKQARHLQKPSILAESKQFCKSLHNYMKYLCQIMQMLDCSSCCQRWYNQIFYFRSIKKIIIQKLHLVFTWVSFVVICSENVNVANNPKLWYMDINFCLLLDLKI